MMIDSIQRRVVAYQLQDLRCGRCKQIKTENLRINCVCSGDYVMADTKASLLGRLTVTANVASVHSLTTLETEVESIREMLS